MSVAAALALAAASPEGRGDGTYCPELPPLENLRYEEDYSLLGTNACTRSALERLKHVPLGASGSYVSLGGEIRLRGEYARNPDFGIDVPEDQVLLQRLLFHADFRLGRGVRAFVQLGSHLAFGRTAEEGPTDEDRLDLAQGFLDLSGDASGGRLTLRLGRQEMSLGSSRLVSVRESPNIRRSFDGVRSFWQAGETRVDAFYLRPVALSKGIFDDATDDAQALYGIHAAAPLLSEGFAANLYVLGYERKAARFAQGQARERRYSVGLRLFGERRGFDWDLEAVYQFGSFGTARIAAWTLASDVGYTFADLAWRPRLALKADVASGDKNPADDVLGTFNPLFPKLPYFAEAGLVAPANIVDVHPTLTLAPLERLSITLGANLLWRHRSADAFYAPPLVPVDADRSSARFLGTQGEIAVEWTPSRHWELKAWYVRFFASDGLAAIGGRDVDYLAASAAWRF